MTPAEAAALLTVAAAFDNRKPDADQAKAWAMALDGFRFVDCRAAVVSHYRVTRDWIMPSDVIGGVKRLRDRRLADYGVLPDPPDGLDPDETAAYVEHLAMTRRRIADGEIVRDQKVEQLAARRDVVAELGHVGREVPPTEDWAKTRAALRGERSEG